MPVAEKLREARADKKAAATVDNLLKAKRADAPTQTFWRSSFEPRFTRKLMGEVAKPRDKGRTLTLVGWLSPAVFIAIMAVAIGVAYIFSPQRAIATWESQANSREYVVDTLHKPEQVRSYALDSADDLIFSASPVEHEISSYEFQSASGSSAAQF